MISRRCCKQIARMWMSNEGLDEYQRRVADVTDSWREHGMPYDSDLIKDCTRAMLNGYYDPPTPPIPGFFARLRMNDWAPPRRTDRMYTGPGTGLYQRLHPEEVR